MLIDVRTQEEYADKHHDGAINIPLDEIATRQFNVPNDTHLILYCRSGARARSAQEILGQRGFTNVSLLGDTGAYS